MARRVFDCRKKKHTATKSATKSAKKPRNRQVVFDPVRYPPYASLKHSNQINPIAFIGVKPHTHSGPCYIYVVRKLIVEPTPGVPLPAQKHIRQSDYNILRDHLRPYRTRLDEHVVRASIGKHRFEEDWMRYKGVDPNSFMENYLTHEEIGILTCYVYLAKPKECFGDGGTYYDSPSSVGTAEAYASTFNHPSRGVQPVHTWITIEQDVPIETSETATRRRFLDDSDDSDDEFVPFDPAIHEYDKTISLKFSDDTDEEREESESEEQAQEREEGEEQAQESEESEEQAQESEESPIVSVPELPDLSQIAVLSKEVLQSYNQILISIYKLE